ncbi:helix-turn-helix transcriptional regulator [Dechloromonas sp.]|uniref:helix-turn-helix transcriptional regulator n=1 Tax=Dechloromonas sp. TaxID=1917218 RepID=UPI00345F96AC
MQLCSCVLWKTTMEKLLSPKALAELLGIATQTIYNRHSLGGDLPPAIKVGRALRFRPSDVSAWLERHRQFADDSPQVLLLPVIRRSGRPTKAEQIARRR